MANILSNLANALESEQDITETIADLKQTAKELRIKNV
jgi:ferritin